MMTFVLIVGALALGLALGWVWKGLLCAREVARCSGRALTARVAVGQALPLLETLSDGLASWRNGVEHQGLDEGEVRAGQALDQALHILRALTWGSGRYWRHNVRGTYYEVLTYHLNLQTSGQPHVMDGDELVLYIDTRSGRLSCRHPVEFHDGRFSRVPRSVALDADALAEQAGAAPAARGYVDQDRELLRRLD